MNRPSKIQNYMSIAEVVALRSHDAETKVGAVLINNESGAIIATGFNGFIRGAEDSKLPNTRPAKYPFFIHAECNLLCNCCRNSIGTNDCTLVCTLSPCIHCLRMSWQAGINSFYFKTKYKDFEQCTNMQDLKVKLKRIESFYYMKIWPK